MKFKDSSTRLLNEFEAKLHPMTRELARRFDIYCLRSGYGDAVVTDISRTPKFYEANALTTPAFSWHLIDCAVDFRNQHLTPAQQRDCEAWLQNETRSSQWERVLTTHGTGPHWHIAYRDWSKRREFSLSNPPKPKPKEKP